MIQLIVGNKGTGKTIRLIDYINGAVETSKGSVVCVEKGNNLRFNLTNKARLIDVDTYGIASFDELYAFVSGLCASNYDITDLCIDGTLKIGGKDIEGFAAFIDRLSALAGKSEVKMLLTVSCDAAELPESVQKVANII
ncbi:MAG: hypothetical protein IKT35_02075 [Clostridia bacterium]|nr:hypothetical protein [Clostridia bacterium]